jgi:nickel/cobalt exporter
LSRRKQSDTAARFIVFLLLFFSSGIAAAHPMGNFSISHYAKLTVSNQSISILYLIDMAEIPAFQEIRRANLVARNHDPSVRPYLIVEERNLANGLRLDCDGKHVPLESVSRDLVFTDGAGGLPTMKLRFEFHGNLPTGAGPHQLSYDDTNFAGRTGWKEVVVLAKGTELVNSSAHERDRSNELSTYSADLLDSPPQQLSVSITFLNKLPQTSKAPR